MATSAQELRLPASAGTLAHTKEVKEEKKVIFASSLGTVFEWYDFYLYATLAPFFAALFFPKGNDTAALLSAFATYAAGFLVRPFGALVFGRLGDLVGRKYTFLVTILVMGGATAAVGFLPTYETIGWAAPILLVTLRLLQGLALGGEYGGAATYVAEHAPDGRRGLRHELDPDDRDARLLHGAGRDRRLPRRHGRQGLLRVGLADSVPGVDHPARLLGLHPPQAERVADVPADEGRRQGVEVAAQGQLPQVPEQQVRAARAARRDRRPGVVWYTGQFYALFFLTITLKVDYLTAYMLIGASLLLGTPFFIFFGRLSDKIGRLKIILAGCLIAALTYFPLFQALTHYVNPALESIHAEDADLGLRRELDCNFHLFVGPWSKFTECDKAKDFLTKQGLSFESLPAVAGTSVVTKIGDVELNGWDEAKYKDALKATGYPGPANNARTSTTR